VKDNTFDAADMDLSIDWSKVTWLGWMDENGVHIFQYDTYDNHPVKEDEDAAE
jgi:hypothetical protein